MLAVPTMRKAKPAKRSSAVVVVLPATGSCVSAMVGIAVGACASVRGVGVGESSVA